MNYSLSVGGPEDLQRNSTGLMIGGRSSICMDKQGKSIRGR